jgi:hypothetical protein
MTSLALDNMPRHDHGWSTNLPDEKGGHEHNVLDTRNEGHEVGGGTSFNVLWPSVGKFDEVKTNKVLTGITWAQCISYQGKATAFENRPPYIALYYIMKL